MRIYQFSTSIHGDGQFCVSDNDSLNISKVDGSVCEKMIRDLLESVPSILTFSNRENHQIVSLKSNQTSRFSKTSERIIEDSTDEELEKVVNEIVEEFVNSDFGSYLCIILED